MARTMEDILWKTQDIDKFNQRETSLEIDDMLIIYLSKKQRTLYFRRGERVEKVTMDKSPGEGANELPNEQ